MKIVSGISVVIVAIIHLAIMSVEMWPARLPLLLARLEGDLGFAAGQSIHAAPIVRNAGLFNGFLAAGLFWGLVSKINPIQIRAFFLICIAIAGVFGAMTLPNPITLLLQTLPASFALAINWWAYCRRGGTSPST